MIFRDKKKVGWSWPFTIWVVILSFSMTLLTSSGVGSAQPSYTSGVSAGLNLPAPGNLLTPSPNFIPTLLRGLKVDPQNPFRFEFFLEQGDADDGKQETFEQESQSLVNYFLACLAVPEEDLWVNLSPFEQDRVIPEAFGQTEMGRDLLAQDYLLKQLTASLLYPEKDLGKRFWDRVRQKAYEEYQTTDIPMDTFHKVWIVPDQARVLEQGEFVIVLGAHLKVMLEEDYLAREKNRSSESWVMGSEPKTHDSKPIINIESKILKELILPEIEKEVNTGRNFAKLRQIYHAMILAAWYKKALKESLLGQVYVDQNQVNGIALEDQGFKEQIYQQYVQAYRQGVFHYIKEEYDPDQQQMIPRKYFSGGVVGVVTPKLETYSVATVKPADGAMLGAMAEKMRAQGFRRVVMELFEPGRLPTITFQPRRIIATLASVVALSGFLGVAPVLGDILEDDHKQTKIKTGNTDEWMARLQAGDLSPIGEAVAIFNADEKNVRTTARDFLLRAAKNQETASLVKRSLIPPLGKSSSRRARTQAILVLREIGLGGVMLIKEELDHLVVGVSRDHRLAPVLATLDPQTVSPQFVGRLRNVFFRAQQPQQAYPLRRALAPVLGQLAPEIAMEVMERLGRQGGGWVFYSPYFLVGLQGQIEEGEFAEWMRRTQRQLGEASFQDLRSMARLAGSPREGAMVDVLVRGLDSRTGFSVGGVHKLFRTPTGDILWEAHFGFLAQMLRARDEGKNRYRIPEAVIDLLQNQSFSDSPMLPLAAAYVLPDLVDILIEGVEEENEHFDFQDFEFRHTVLVFLVERGLLETAVIADVEGMSQFLMKSIEYEMIHVRRGRVNIERNIAEKNKWVLSHILEIAGQKISGDDEQTKAFVQVARDRAEEIINLYPHRIGLWGEYPEEFDREIFRRSHPAIVAMYDFLNPWQGEFVTTSGEDMEQVEQAEGGEQISGDENGVVTIHRSKQGDHQVRVVETEGSVALYADTKEGGDPIFVARYSSDPGASFLRYEGGETYWVYNYFGLDLGDPVPAEKQEVWDEVQDFVNEVRGSTLDEISQRTKASWDERARRLALFHLVAVDGQDWVYVDEILESGEVTYLVELVAIEGATAYEPYRRFVLEQWGESLDRLAVALSEIDPFNPATFEREDLLVFPGGLRHTLSTILLRSGKGYMESQNKIFDYLQAARSVSMIVLPDTDQIVPFILEHQRIFLADMENGYQDFSENHLWIFDLMIRLVHHPNENVSVEDLLDYFLESIDIDPYMAVKVWVPQTLETLREKHEGSVPDRYRSLVVLGELARRPGSSDEAIELKAQMVGRYLNDVARKSNPMRWDEAEQRILEKGWGERKDADNGDGSEFGTRELGVESRESSLDQTKPIRKGQFPDVTPEDQTAQRTEEDPFVTQVVGAPADDLTPTQERVLREIAEIIDPWAGDVDLTAVFERLPEVFPEAVELEDGVPFDGEDRLLLLELLRQSLEDNGYIGASERLEDLILEEQSMSDRAMLGGEDGWLNLRLGITVLATVAALSGFLGMADSVGADTPLGDDHLEGLDERDALDFLGMRESANNLSQRSYTPPSFSLENDPILNPRSGTAVAQVGGVDVVGEGFEANVNRLAARMLANFEGKGLTVGESLTDVRQRILQTLFQYARPERYPDFYSDLSDRYSGEQMDYMQRKALATLEQIVVELDRTEDQFGFNLLLDQIIEQEAGDLLDHFLRRHPKEMAKYWSKNIEAEVQLAKRVYERLRPSEQNGDDRMWQQKRKENLGHIIVKNRLIFASMTRVNRPKANEIAASYPQRVLVWGYPEGFLSETLDETREAALKAMHELWIYGTESVEQTTSQSDQQQEPTSQVQIVEEGEATLYYVMEEGERKLYMKIQPKQVGDAQERPGPLDDVVLTLYSHQDGRAFPSMTFLSTPEGDEFSEDYVSTVEIELGESLGLPSIAERSPAQNRMLEMARKAINDYLPRARKAKAFNAQNFQLKLRMASLLTGRVYDGTPQDLEKIARHEADYLENAFWAAEQTRNEPYRVFVLEQLNEALRELKNPLLRLKFDEARGITWDLLQPVFFQILSRFEEDYTESHFLILDRLSDLEGQGAIPQRELFADNLNLFIDLWELEGDDLLSYYKDYEKRSPNYLTPPIFWMALGMWALHTSDALDHLAEDIGKNSPRAYVRWAASVLYGEAFAEDVDPPEELATMLMLVNSAYDPPFQLRMSVHLPEILNGKTWDQVAEERDQRHNHSDVITPDDLMDLGIKFLDKEISSEATPDTSQLGGITMSSQYLDFQIERDEQGQPLPREFQNWEQLKAVDLTPVFLHFGPANLQSVPFLSRFIKEEPSRLSQLP